MIRAGGVFFISLSTGRICLALRSETVGSPFTWSGIGGKIERDESVLEGISREIREEFGYLPDYIKAIPIDIFKSIDGNFEYHSFIVIVQDEFIPTLNSEHSGYGWFNINGLPRPMHNGTKKLLLHRNFQKIVTDLLHDIN